MFGAFMSRKIWIGILVLLLLGGGVVVGGKVLLRHRAMQWRQQGLAAADAGDYAKSADLLARYLRRYGGDTRTLRQYVKVRELAELPNGQHLADTINALKLLLSRDPELDDRRHLLDLYVRLERAPEALDVANAILATNKNDSRTLKIKVDMLTRLHREREALGIAQDWIHSAPNDIDAQMAYFSLRSAVEQSSDVILADAKNLVDQHPNDPRFEMLLGSVYARLGDVPNARQWLNQAAGRTGLTEDTVTIIVAQFDSLGLAQDSALVLRQRAKTGASPDLRHLLGQRDWEVGAWAEAADMLADIDPKDLKSDATLVAQRAMALTNLGRKADAQPIRAALSARNQAAAKAWALLLNRILDSAVIDDKQIVSVCRAALLLDAMNPYLNYYAGDASARLGESELAIEAWQRSVAADPTWSTPSVRLVDLLLQKGRGDQALAIALRAQRTGNAAAVIMLARAAAVHFESGGAGDREQLFKLIDTVQERIPGEEQTLLARVDLLSQQGKKDEATKLARSMLERRPALDERVLLPLASVSRKYKLGIDNEALTTSEQAHGLTPSLAYVRAVSRFLAAGADAGLKEFDDSAKRAAKADDPAWRLARARYLDATANPAAHDAWVALGDAFPISVQIQQAAASARAVSHDWGFMQRTIDRLRALTADTGDEALGWRLAKARLMVDAPRSDADAEQASILLNQILRTDPALPEAHVLLAQALVQLKRIDGAIDHLSYAARLEPGNVPVALQLASLLQSRGQFDRVRQELEGINLRMQSSDQRHQAALLLARQGNLDKAIALLEEQQKTDGATPDLLLAALYRRQNQLDKAESMVKRLLEKPDLPAIQFAAALYAGEGKPADAQAALARLDSLKLEPGDKESTLAGYALQTGKLDDAIQHFADATRQAPTKGVLWRALAACEIVAGKTPEALATIDQATRALPDDKGFASLKQQSALLGPAAADPGLRPVALAIIRDPASADTSFELLRIITDGRQSLDNEHLAAQLQQLAERHPESLQAQLQLVRVYLEMGRNIDALATAQRAMNTFAIEPEPARLAVRVAAAAQRWQDMINAAQAWKNRSSDEAAAADLAILRAQLGMHEYASVITQLQPYISQIKADPQKNPDLTEAYCIAMTNTGGADDASALLWPLAQQSPPWRLRWGQVALEYADASEAAQWLDRLGGIIPAAAIDERLMLAEMYDRLAKRTNDPGLSQKATEIYGQVAGDPKTGAVALLAAGYRAESHGDPRSAEALYRRAIAADSTLFIARNNLAMLLVKNGGNLSEAQQLALDAIKAQPRIPGIRDTLAFVQAKARNFRGAAESERLAIELEPDNLTWRVHQATYLLESGDLVQASDALKALDSARLDLRKAPPDIQQELQSLRARIRPDRAQASSK